MKGHHKFKWEGVETFGDSGPKPMPPPPSHKQMGLANPAAPGGEISSSCSTWSEPVAVSPSNSSAAVSSTSRYDRNVVVLGNQFLMRFYSQHASYFALG